MASVGAEEWGRTYQTPGGSCRRQSWRVQWQKSGRCGDQAGGPLNAKDCRSNQPSWEMRQRFPDWRMRSPSEEGRDNTPLLERGPLGSGGTSSVKGPHTEAGSLAGACASRRLESTYGKPPGRCRKGVDSVLDCYPKLVAIDEQAESCMVVVVEKRP